MKEKVMLILKKIKPDLDLASPLPLFGTDRLDSLDLVRLLTECRKELDIDIPPEELLPENFETVDSICNLLERVDNL